MLLWISSEISDYKSFHCFVILITVSKFTFTCDDLFIIAKFAYFICHSLACLRFRYKRKQFLQTSSFLDRSTPIERSLSQSLFASLNPVFKCWKLDCFSCFCSTLWQLIHLKFGIQRFLLLHQTSMENHSLNLNTTMMSWLLMMIPGLFKKAVISSLRNLVQSKFFWKVAAWNLNFATIVEESKFTLYIF